MRKNVLIMAVVAFMAATGGYFFAMMINPSTEPQGPGVTLETRPVAAELVGQRRPDFTHQDSLGNAVSASDFDGRVWLVNFWATWCEPCVEEMPMLSRLQQEYEREGVRFVGIALDDADRAGEFASGLDLAYPILVGKADVVMTGRRFGNATGMLPFSVLIDSEGIIRWTRLGALSREDLQEQITRLLRD